MHGRNTFAFGIIFNMQSVRHVALASMLRIQSPLKYLLTYKLSQDHLELFFSCIRSRGGWNNNPNAYQFKCAMRKFLLGNCVSPVNGNCFNFNVSYLPPIYNFNTKRDIPENDGADIENEVGIWCSLLDEKIKFSFYKQNILFYIAGYVSMRLSKQITCHDCLHILKPPVVETVSEHDNPYAFANTAKKNAFVRFVSRGKLVETSDTVYSIVEYAEKLFQINIIHGDMRQKNLLAKILHCIKKKFVDYPFPALSHDYDNEFGIEDLHQTQLVCKIASLHYHTSKNIW